MPTALLIAALSLFSRTGGIASWDEAMTLGNGVVGALVWGEGGTLNITFDRADFWVNVPDSEYLGSDYTWQTLLDCVRKGDHERRMWIFRMTDGGSSKLPGVRLAIKLNEGDRIAGFALDSKKELVTVAVDSQGVVRDLVAWFDDGDDMMTMALPDGFSFASMEFIENGSFARLGGFPEPVVDIAADHAIYRRENRSRGKFDRGFSAGLRLAGPGAKPKHGYVEAFCAESSVSIPDSDLQQLYDFAMHLYCAGSRRPNPPLALQGLWTCDDGQMPPWQGDYHNDLNIQMTYWAAPPAGHFDSIEAMCDFYIALLPEFQRFAREVFGFGEGAIIPGAMGYAGQEIRGWSAYNMQPTEGLWVFATICDAWYYNPSVERARRYLEFGRELEKGIRQCYEKDADGVNRLHLSSSPEWGDDGPLSYAKPNTTYDRTLLEEFHKRLGDLAEAAGFGEEAAGYRALAKTFGPELVREDGLVEISEGVLMDESHRHPSHLIWFFPMNDLPCGIDAEKCVSHWEGLGPDWWCGYSYAWAACFDARLGKGDAALEKLKTFAKAFVSECGFHLNGDQTKSGYSRYEYRPMTLEGNFGFARAVQEMLLGYDWAANELSIFPAIPAEWDGKEISFRNLRIPGGHSVSAVRHADGSVEYSLSEFANSPIKPPKVSARK